MEPQLLAAWVLDAFNAEELVALSQARDKLRDERTPADIDLIRRYNRAAKRYHRLRHSRTPGVRQDYQDWLRQRGYKASADSRLLWEKYRRGGEPNAEGRGKRGKRGDV